MSVRKEDIAAIFAEMADIMDILGEDSFRVNSYRRSTRFLSETTEDIGALAEAGERLAAKPRRPALMRAKAAARHRKVSMASLRGEEAR